MIRFLLIALFLVIFLVLSIPVFLIEWIIGKFSPRARDISSLRIVQAGFKIIIWMSGIKLTVKGEENVPKDTAVLYIGNHRSYFDIVLTYARCPGLTGYVAKKEMLKIPLLSRWMKFLHCQFLDRSDIREGLKTILAAAEEIKNGVSIMIFPEGTRSTNESELDMLPFHEGSFKIATKTGCPIIPVAISGSSAAFEDHIPRVFPAHVTIEYGKPVYPKDLSREEQKFLGRRVQGTIAEMLKGLHSD
ncbi:MAG TPA: 1-acyl-sn-glycerol-3-phosphate acyltransferase [Candidatus Choladousia intestinipullorum]|nr:1-acyl-sn-glycerol-3-phosphate acyltransferase [Candidatus Choladousia intestinipullorum]